MCGWCASTHPHVGEASSVGGPAGVLHPLVGGIGSIVCRIGSLLTRLVVVFRRRVPKASVSATLRRTRCARAATSVPSTSRRRSALRAATRLLAFASVRAFFVCSSLYPMLISIVPPFQSTGVPRLCAGRPPVPAACATSSRSLAFSRTASVLVRYSSTRFTYRELIKSDFQATP